ncbi:hypothetical protein RND71_011255 [Anisodus tanguticus]|uniref:Uncharacterized protein n=1 Tax=Anisodus tanguticus TaxID=243964 RepID=A0AAE1VEX5_9SOLA|nr:hypothetical protein RND71_011255 [Anisodus tanguticus]
MDMSFQKQSSLNTSRSSKAESTGDLIERVAANVSTKTYDRRRQRREMRVVEHEEELREDRTIELDDKESDKVEQSLNLSTELNREIGTPQKDDLCASKKLSRKYQRRPWKPLLPWTKLEILRNCLGNT